MPLRTVHHDNEPLLLRQQPQQKAPEGLEVEAVIGHETLDAAVVGGVLTLAFKAKASFLPLVVVSCKSEPT